MGIMPVASSRVSEPLKTSRLLYQLNADQIAIQKSYDQLSTGKRVTRVSDDPARRVGQSFSSAASAVWNNSAATQA
jgi:flagellin-like hook-associated protein FlgL